MKENGTALFRIGPLLPRSHSAFAVLGLSIASSLLAGCGHKRPAQASIPPPPPVSAPGAAQSPAAGQPTAVAAEPQIAVGARPLRTEIGMASWYGPDYNHRKAANGEVYDQDQFTAAHRTLPLNSVARVTNLTTRESVLVRITDRGPFVTDRVIDLSKAAAQRVGVYRHGTAKVKIELLQSPAGGTEDGRWAVQIGAFKDEETAQAMKERLARRYHSAKVLEFSGPRHDWWVRVRVLDDDKRRAEEVARDNSTVQGAVFLVRLD